MTEDIRFRAVLITLVLVILVSVGVDMLPDYKIQIGIKPDVSVPQQLHTDELFAQGVKQLQQGQNYNALDSFRHVLKAAPRMPEAYSNLGFAHFGLKHYDRAAEAFNTALDINPSQVNAYWGLAISLEALCDIPAAMGAMRTYIHLAQQDDPYLKKARAALWEWEQEKLSASNGPKSQAGCKG